MASKKKTNSAKTTSAKTSAQTSTAKKAPKRAKPTSTKGKKQGTANGRKGLVAKAAEAVAEVMTAAASGAVKGAAIAGTEVFTRAVGSGGGDTTSSAKANRNTSGSAKKTGSKKTSRGSK